MRKVVAALTIAIPFCLGTTAALAEEKAAPTQQSKMAYCNKEAVDKKGDERKAFMSECLTNKQARQQDKMKSCNKDAEGKKGDERKAFMSECLKK
ncbi:MAG: phosphate starvation-inducible protein PsiF [Aeromicrobium sp.]|nr:phosphate starvation-inducible protein PsiF [Burkholderiales bacterium]